MTKETIQRGSCQTSKGNPQPLVQALDTLAEDHTSWPGLSLPERTVVEIQPHFTINKLVSAVPGSGIANDAGNSHHLQID